MLHGPCFGIGSISVKRYFACKSCEWLRSWIRFDFGRLALLTVLFRPDAHVKRPCFRKNASHALQIGSQGGNLGQLLCHFHQMVRTLYSMARSGPEQGRRGCVRQTFLARAEELRRSAKALVTDALADLETAMDLGSADLIAARAFFCVSLSRCGESCLRAVEMMAAAAGAAAIKEDCPPERCMRDVHAAVKHIATAPHNFVVGGKVPLGSDLGTARFCKLKLHSDYRCLLFRPMVSQAKRGDRI